MNIVCPLCGRHVPENVFDPSNFEDDIYAVDVTGLGRGYGFAVTEKYSILDDYAVTGLIGDRCHRILGMIGEETSLPPEEGDALRATLEQWIQYARKLESENAELQQELEQTDDDDDEDDSHEMNRLLRKINRSVSFEFDSLEEAIGFLLEN
jgi:hypothetical protein